MSSPMKRALALAALMLTAATGCPPAQPMPPPQPSPTQPPSMSPRSRFLMNAQGGGIAGNSAAANVPFQLQVDFYQLTVPFGTVSRNEQFWKRVDEQVVDVATYDLLFKNGIRVGQAPIAEWDYFRAIMEQHPTFTKANTLVGSEGKPVELPMRKEVPWENIFYFNAQNEPIGRTYEQSENFVTLTFQSAPRKTDTMRLALCPVVRATRRHLEYSTMNNELGEVKYVAPERIYDLNLRTDVPVGNLLIVAPSQQANWPTSIGNAFFVHDGAAEKMETVLLIVPKTVHLEEAPVRATPK